MASARWPDATARSAPIGKQRHRQEGGHSPESRLIAEGFGEGLGFAKEVEHPGKLAERIQGMSKIDPEINGLLERLPTLGEMLEDGQRLLEALDCLPVGGARECLGAGLAKIGERPIPHFAAESVVSEPCSARRSR
jgi:hypothetical protein